MKYIYLILVTLLLSSNLSLAQKKNPDPDFGNLVKELTRASKKGENMTQVVWFPEAYWEMVFKDNPSVDEELIKEIQNTFGNYVIFLTFDVNIDLTGFKKNPIDNFELIYEGQKIKPITEYNSEISTFLSFVGPMFQQMMGQLGESIEIFVFDNQKKIFPSAYEKGQMEVILNSQVFKYRLPISELVLKKTCPVDGEKVNGSWDFCPWHGVKLN